MQTCYEVITDSRWEIIKEIVTDQRKRKYNLRDVFDALFYILLTGTQWRNIPDNYPPWETVYYYFRKWKKDGTFECVNTNLNKLESKRQGKKETPSLLCAERRPIVINQLRWLHSLAKTKALTAINSLMVVKGISLLIRLD